MYDSSRWLCAGIISISVVCCMVSSIVDMLDYFGGSVDDFSVTVESR